MDIPSTVSKLPVKNANLVRDRNSTALLSVDLEAKKAYDRKRAFYKSMQTTETRLIDALKRIEMLEQRIHTLESLVFDSKTTT